LPSKHLATDTLLFAKQALPPRHFNPRHAFFRHRGQKGAFSKPFSSPAVVLCVLI
jgi:hypothetical protein